MTYQCFTLGMHGTFYVTHSIDKHWVDMAARGQWKSEDGYRSVISIIVI